jgi:hypothetical protein
VSLLALSSLVSALSVLCGEVFSGWIHKSEIENPKSDVRNPKFHALRRLPISNLWLLVLELEAPDVKIEVATAHRVTISRQIYLGDDRFIKRMQGWLDDEKVNDVNVPRAQRRGPAPPLEVIRRQYKDKKKAVVAAYETGAYSYQQIGEHFGVHFTTVGRVVRAARNNQTQAGRME